MNRTSADRGRTPDNSQETANPVKARRLRATPAPARHTYKSKGYVRPHIPNNRNRWTPYLDASKVLDLIEASVHAEKILRPLNLFVTLHFERAGLPDHHRPQDALGAWLKRAGQWLHLRDVPLTFVWVLEHAPGTGVHAHMMIHCPPPLQKAFREKSRKSWLRKSGMTSKDRRGIHFAVIGPRGYDLETASLHQKQTYKRKLKGLVRYFVKNINPNQLYRLDGNNPILLATALRINPEYSVPIYGRRMSRSQNIGKKARESFIVDRLP